MQSAKDLMTKKRAKILERDTKDKKDLTWIKIDSIEEGQLYTVTSQKGGVVTITQSATSKLSRKLRNVFRILKAQSSFFNGADVQITVTNMKELLEHGELQS